MYVRTNYRTVQRSVYVYNVRCMSEQITELYNVESLASVGNAFTFKTLTIQCNSEVPICRCM